MTKQALTLESYGPAFTGVTLREHALADMAPNQVRVRVKATPIHPADLNVCEGAYAWRPELPAIIGNEGVGVIEECGVSARANFKVGDHVVAPSLPGWWCESFVADAADLYTIPPGLDTLQAAQITVTPATAWALLHDIHKLVPGSWVLQNAANSAVGRCVIQIARLHGIRTVNIVRREDVVQELKDLGGDVVLPHSNELKDQVQAMTRGADIHLALNAVSGDALRATLRCLAPNSTVVTYGAMSREPVTLSNRHLIFNNLTARGFWITGWYRDAKQWDRTSRLDKICSLIRDGSIRVDVEQTYALHDYRDALAHAARDRRNGKILFTF